MSDGEVGELVRRHVAVTLVVTCVTAWFSYAYFHGDEYFQIIGYVRSKLGHIEPRYLPWEHAQQIRPWLQPFFYWLVARALIAIGVDDLFDLAFAFRLLTGLTNVVALTLFLRTTLPWMKTRQEKVLHARVATLLGFLPYLFVRTSSESASMALATAAFAVLLAGASASPDHARWCVPNLAHPARSMLAGFLFGLSFEMRFQTAFLALGVLVWLVVFGGGRGRALALLGAGGLAALATGALADRWGYGVWTFPPWGYFRVNLLEGAAKHFGTDPPFAYFWISAANLQLPVVAVLLVLAVVAWLRCPRHPITWATLPFFVVHNLIAHKEERFMFPIAIASTALVTMALGPSFDVRSLAPRVTERIARWGWRMRRAWPGKLLAATSLAGMLLFALVPIGWNHNVRFMRFIHDHIGDELHATALPDIVGMMPSFHPRIYDVETLTADELARRIEGGTARPWLITDTRTLPPVPTLKAHARLVFTELPFFRHPRLAGAVLRVVDAYNAHAPSSLRRVRFRSLYRIE